MIFFHCQLFVFSLLEALKTGSAFSRDQKRKRAPRAAGGKQSRRDSKHSVKSWGIYLHNMRLSPRLFFRTIFPLQISGGPLNTWFSPHLPLHYQFLNLSLVNFVLSLNSLFPVLYQNSPTHFFPRPGRKQKYTYTLKTSNGFSRVNIFQDWIYIYEWKDSETPSWPSPKSIAPPPIPYHTKEWTSRDRLMNMLFNKNF